MKPFQLPVDLLKKFTPDDEDFPHLKAKMDEKIALMRIRIEKGEGSAIDKFCVKWNEDAVVRVICGYLYLFFQRPIHNWVNGITGEGDEDSEQNSDDMQAKYLKYLAFEEKMKKI